MKCAKCGHKWREFPPTDLPKQVAEDIDTSEELASGTQNSGAGMSIEEMTNVAPAPKSRPVPEKKKRNWLGWIVFVFLLAGIVAGGFYGKQYVVEFWPASAKLYQMLKLDVKTENQLGLEIRDLKTKSVLENGVVRLTVTGTIVNLTGSIRPIPRIGIQLVDGEGHHVYSWSTAIDQKNVEAWKSVEFSSSMNQPPEDAKHVKADLIVPKKKDAEHSN